MSKELAISTIPYYVVGSYTLTNTRQLKIIQIGRINQGIQVFEPLPTTWITNRQVCSLAMVGNPSRKGTTEKTNPEWWDLIVSHGRHNI